jgi:hypothetical protein
MLAHALPALEELAETMGRSLPHGDRDAHVPGHRRVARGMVAVLELDQVATGLHVGHPDLERLIIDTGARDRIADRPAARSERSPSRRLVGEHLSRPCCLRHHDSKQEPIPASALP